MMSIRSLSAVATLVFLAGCATGGDQYEKAMKMQPKGNDFTKALFAEYLDLSKRDLADGDARNSDANALKAAMAAEGAEVQPDEIASRTIPANALGELTQARSRLMAALGTGRQRAPAQAAKAQAMFDCWLEQVEKRSRPTDLQRCKDGFSQAVALLPAAAPAQAAPRPAGPPQKFVVYFERNSAALSTAANRVLEQAIAAAKDAASVDVVGYTDTSGSPRTNFALSSKRAEAVVQALVKGGVPAPRISQSSMGENNPAVPTADNVREERNRRVEISVTK